MIDTLEMCDNRLAVSLAFPDFDRAPVAILLQKPAFVVEDRFARPGMRKDLDPAPDAEKASYATQYDRLSQFLDQFAAWALRCRFSSEATRSEGCAPCPIQ